MITTGLFKLAATCSDTVAGLPNLYRGLCSGGEIQLTSLQDITKIIANLVQIVLALAGMLAIMFIVVGGIFYVISAGDPGKIKRAKDILTDAITGLIIILGSYAVIVFITSKF